MQLLVAICDVFIETQWYDPRVVDGVLKDAAAATVAAGGDRVNSLVSPDKWMNSGIWKL